MQELGLRMLEVFYRETGEPQVAAVEQPFSVPILDPATMETLESALVGIFDLVEREDSGAVVIVDFKTAARKYADFQVENSLQLALYAYAATLNGLADGEDVLLRFDVLTKRVSSSWPPLLRALGELSENPAYRHGWGRPTPL